MATASKAALVIAILLVIAIVIWRASMLKQAWQRLSSPSLRIIALAAVVLAIGALGWFGWQRMMYRWTQDQWVSQSWGARMIAYQACLSMLPDSSWWGIGAGNFSIDFPFYTNAFGASIEGLWRFAHEDYLQTIIEWGYVGAVVWAVLFFGGLISGIRAQRQASTVLSTADRTFLFTVLLAFIGVLLHSTVDFPLQIGSLQLYAALYLGMLWGARDWRSARTERRVKA
jgi:O-antigen ligase